MPKQKNKETNPHSEVEKTKSDFINSISHELRTPLCVVKQCLEIIDDESSGPLTTTQKGFVETAHKNTERLIHFINEILDFQVYDHMDFKLNLTKTDINKLAQEAYEKFEAFSKAKSIELELELEEGLSKVSVDKEKIEVVFSHILENAFNFSDEGKVIIRTLQNKTHLEISVEDQGIGIKESDLPKLFYSFSHLADHTDKHTRGAGLGLATCKKIINRHKGDLKVTSVFGEGSTFTFTLPL